MAQRLAIPIILYGKSPAMAEKAVVKLKPEYEVIKTFHSFEGSANQLPPLLESPSASVVVVGGAFTGDMIQTARQLPNSDKVPWLQDNKFKPSEERQAMTAEDLATDFVDRVKACLRNNGVAPGCDRGTGAGALWLY